ncbi:CUN024 putative p39 late capsid coat protein, similar to AcMNPV ORF89 [Culex nigripalpus nucleopolyhedrovirus]|uniref:CUN024 putative p39 late capsid coat protein, similar to AcMNPV ORF89 n=1 Tax=Culex nigripalpus nucleopolyhedrovirus (isolate Florida/1997) TaxID=645993 RepID=Q919P5_NPVCO|nr:CUN024 putative p39 late capsid coat protein, similar to AcMNPV ORF89 [Culex nigripalpus nucleopolyhedrovirus]AAK94102.1 CUN024 putative p39 late capsid coat protein, similar to AcMNPV ORF89 [Culex nigripalpus nucleopolyhedrovirus]
MSNNQLSRRTGCVFAMLGTETDNPDTKYTNACNDKSLHTEKFLICPEHLSNVFKLRVCHVNPFANKNALSNAVPVFHVLQPTVSVSNTGILLPLTHEAFRNVLGEYINFSTDIIVQLLYGVVTAEDACSSYPRYIGQIRYVSEILRDLSDSYKSCGSQNEFHASNSERTWTVSKDFPTQDEVRHFIHNLPPFFRNLVENGLAPGEVRINAVVHKMPNLINTAIYSDAILLFNSIDPRGAEEKYAPKTGMVLMVKHVVKNGNQRSTPIGEDITPTIVPTNGAYTINLATI